MNNIRELLLKELAATYYSEQQFVAVLTKWQKAATNSTLKAVIYRMTKESEWNWNHIPTIFQSFNIKPSSSKNGPAEALADAAKQLAGGFRRPNAINSALISAALKIGYYKEAAYKSLHEWAGLLINKEAVRLLEVILQKEIISNQALAASARTIFKEEALSTAIEAACPENRPKKHRVALSMNTRLFNLSQPMPMLM